MRCNLRLSVPRATPGSMTRSRAGDDPPWASVPPMRRPVGREPVRHRSHRVLTLDPSAIRDGRTLAWLRPAPQARPLLRIRNRGFRAALHHHLHSMVCVNPVTHRRVSRRLMIALARQGISDPHGGARTALHDRQLQLAGVRTPAVRARARGRRTTRWCIRTVESRLWTDAQLTRVGWTGRLARARGRSTRGCGRTHNSRVRVIGRLTRVDRRATRAQWRDGSRAGVLASHGGPGLL